MFGKLRSKKGIYPIAIANWWRKLVSYNDSKTNQHLKNDALKIGWTSAEAPSAAALQRSIHTCTLMRKTSPSWVVVGKYNALLGDAWTTTNLRKH